MPEASASRGTIPRQIRQQGLPRFDFLLGALPGRAAPSDIDMVLEKRGHFLFIECKRPGQRIEKGQEILLDQLVRLSQPEATVQVMIVVGHPPDEITQFGYWREPLRETDVWTVREHVANWFAWASDQ